MENRILINGIWYVAENPAVNEVKTVDWLISKLQDLSDKGYGNFDVTHEIDFGGDYDTIQSIDVINEDKRVHFS